MCLPICMQNTTIPEILGAASVYEATGDIKYLTIVKEYWRQAVVERECFATGGQTCGEVWTPKHKLNTRLGNKTQEHCTVYNMMRLAKFYFVMMRILLTWTIGKKYV